MMGVVLVTETSGVAQPRVGLLNIGKEEIKGNELVKGAHKLISSIPRNEINYVGFIEADQIYNGEADVVVCDGFV